MSEWSDVTLADISDRVDYGYTASASDDPGLPRFLRITDIAQPHLDWSGVPGCPIDETKFEKYALARNDIVIARTGATVGYAKRIRTHPRAVFASYLVRFRLAPDANPSFVGAIVESQDYKLWVQQNAGGAAQPNASAKVLGAYPFRLPDTETQANIGTIFDTIAELIENNRRRVEVLEQMARAIYREWFVKFRYPGHEDVPLVASPLGPIPEGWQTPQLSDHVRTKYGYTESASKDPIGPKYLRGMDINKTSFIDWSTVPYCPINEAAVDKFRITVGDVFVIRMADPGKVGICEEEVEAVFASYLVRLRPTSEALSPYFLFFTLSGDAYQAWVTGASTGATRKSVSAKVMTEPRVVLPPVALQDGFEQAIGPMRAGIAALVSANAKLAALRDLLLPKLVTGQIDVSTLDLDALLEEQAA